VPIGSRSCRQSKGLSGLLDAPTGAGRTLRLTFGLETGTITPSPLPINPTRDERTVTRKILVVDSDHAFATILKEGLEAAGGYQVTLTHAGGDALELVVERHFDMVIVDMGLSDVKPLTLIRAIREAKPAMRLMIIPLFGQQASSELQELEIQGMLPKPFFVGDLPDIVARAIGEELPEASAAPAPKPEAAVSAGPGLVAHDVAKSAPPIVQKSPPGQEHPATPLPAIPQPEPPAFSAETLRRLRAKEKQMAQLLKSLNREVRAESIIVTLGAELVAYAGLLGREQAAKLAALVAASTQAAASSAAFLGEPEGRFEQSLHEGAEYRLYSLNLAEGLVLSLALSSELPLGTLRYRTRQTAEELLGLLA